MSIVVPVTHEAAAGAGLARTRRRRIRAAVLSLAALLLIGSLAAVPLPVWAASHDVAARASTLQLWLDDARREEREVQAYRAGGGELRAVQAAAAVRRWLSPHDLLATRNLLLKTARACGLDVTGAELVPDVDPWSLNVPRRQTPGVLDTGAAAATPEAGMSAAPGRTAALLADSCVLTGTGSLSALLLYCGVLRAMPAPLRLRSVRCEQLGDAHKFTVTVDKLHDGSRSTPRDQETEGGRDAVDDA